MLLKFCIDEDFVNYKKPNMFLGCPYCSFKCNKDTGVIVCQNVFLKDSPVLDIPNEVLVNRYLKNDLTSAIVFGGLEPFDSLDDVIEIIRLLREKSNDDVVIYTGYTEEECHRFGRFEELISYGNIIIKFGRYVPNGVPHFDDTLKIFLASENQYAKRY